MPIHDPLSPLNLLRSASFWGAGNCSLHPHGLEGAAVFVQYDPCSLTTTNLLNGRSINQSSQINPFHENLELGL